MFFLILSLILFIFKSARLLNFLLGLEFLFLGLIFNMIFFNKMIFYFIFLFLGIISSITCLVLFLFLISFFGKDYVIF